MAFTAYCQLASTGPSQIAPAQFATTVEYNVVDSTSGNLATLANGTKDSTVSVTLIPPITQASVLTALQNAVQAAEPGTPGLAFVWLKV